MQQAGKANSKCPVCEENTFIQTDSKFNLVDTLKQWEEGASIIFRKSVWSDYSNPSMKTVYLYRCANCSFEMFLPPVSGSVNFYADITKSAYYTSEKWEFIQALKIIRKFKPKRILDIGCGDGNFLDLLKNNNISSDCVGYEFSIDVANLASNKGHKVLCGEFQEVFKNELTYDVICMFQVLEHLPNPVDFLNTVLQFLAPGGLLLIGVPNAAGPIRHFSSALTEIPPHHVSRWSEQVFKMGLYRFNLQIDLIKYEPLPFYLWEWYLPVMFAEGDIFPRFLGKYLNKYKTTQALISLFTFLGIKWLHGIKGHTLFVVLHKN